MVCRTPASRLNVHLGKGHGQCNEAVLDEPFYSSLMGSTLMASCADVIEHKLALWTFVERDDVSPTNNNAERKLLRSFSAADVRSGTQSERSNVFAARMMTVAHKQTRTPSLSSSREFAHAWTARPIGVHRRLASCIYARGE
jgi:hypothetical protein